jgi:diadenosine tetraphosphate (Ap4A) HIT family hydrolase
VPCTIRRFRPKPKHIKEQKMSDCIFCQNLPKVMENDLVYALYDIKPISKGHMLFIPKRHFEQVFEATGDELKAMFDLINQAKKILDKEHHPDGYNIAANCGTAAGQIVMHAHLHLIPRYQNN